MLQSSNGKYSSHRSQKSKKTSNGGNGKSKVGGQRQKPDLDTSIKSMKQSEHQMRNPGARSRANATAENISARQGPYQLSQVNYGGGPQRQPAQTEDAYLRGRSQPRDDKPDEHVLPEEPIQAVQKELDSGRRVHGRGSASDDKYHLKQQPRNLNEDYSLGKLRQVVAHKCNTNETPTIIQFNNVKDAVISVGISSNGRILEGSNPRIIHSHQ